MQRYLEIERNFFLKFWLKFGGKAIATSAAAMLQQVYRLNQLL